MMLTTLLAGYVMAPAPAPKVVAASLFKNGYAIITREIPLDAKGESNIVEIPQSSLGTLWFSTPKGTLIESIVNTEQEIKNENQASSMESFLQLNVGKTVTLTTVNLGVVTGKIVVVQGDIITLETGESTKMFQRGEIRQIEIAGAKTSFTSTSTQRVLKLVAKGGGPVYMVSLERGMTWAPGYAVELKDDKTLTLTSKATVLDDLADLNNVETRFITGFPNVPFAGLPDPLVSGQSVDQFVGLVGGFDLSRPSGAGRGRAGEMMSQNAAAPAMGGFGDSVDIQSLPGLQAEELFFYRRPAVTLKRGDRAYFVLFHTDAPFERIYTWDIGDAVENDMYRPVPNEVAEDVWQTIKFKNTSGQPLTTAAATTFKDGQIIGQDMLRYTSAGADAQLRITKSLDVHAARSEEEVSRIKQAINVSGIGNFDLVTLKGTLEVENRKPDAVKLKIKKEITGEVISTEGSPKITKTAKGLRQMNPRSLLEWTLDVPSGKHVSVSYTYKVYIRY